MSIEKTGFNKRGTSLNLIASLVAYGLSVLISFIISPYITETLGVEANGFVGLANQFIGYISLITVALNSMASRFVSVHIIDDDYDKANRYFTSVVVANIFIGFVLLFPLGICSFYADKLFLGVGAIMPEYGVMDYHVEETNLRRHYIKQAKLGIKSSGIFDDLCLNLIK